MTSLYTLFKLNDSVDLEKAKELAKDLSYEYDTISIRINDDREMAIICSTIIPDAKSLMAVIPYMLEVVNKGLDVFLTSYERAINQHGIAYEDVDSRLKRYDKKRGDFFNVNTRMNWSSMLTYDLCLNSTTLGEEACARIIADTVRASAEKPAHIAPQEPTNA